MRAVILAGGRGTRLAPYTTIIPKPLLPVGEVPILEILLRRLVREGVERITVCLGHRSNIIKLYLADVGLDVPLDYSEETEPLGTMGPLRQLDDLPKDFLVLNGDLLTDVSFAGILERHRKLNSTFSIAASRREVATEFGVLEVEQGTGTLLGFREKPRLSYTVSMGIYAMNRAVVELIPPGRPYGFDELVLELLRRGTPPAVIEHDGLWLDLGREEDFLRAQEMFEQVRHRVL